MRIGGVTGLTMLVEAAFGYDPDDPAPVWTNITTYVRGFNTRRGRKREIDRVTAGQCTIMLDNRDRRFEGGYTGGAYGSNVVPMVPIRIRVTRNAVTYPIFYGFADEWVPAYDAKVPDYAVVNLRATDGFKVLALIPAPESVYAIAVSGDTPHAWWRLGEKNDPRMFDSSGNGRHGMHYGGTTSTAGFVPYGTLAATDYRVDRDGYSKADATEATVVSDPMTVEAWVDLTGVNTASLFRALVSQTSQSGDSWAINVGGNQVTGQRVNNQIQFTHSGGGNTFWNTIPDGVHHIVATHGSGTSKFYLDGVLVDTDSSTFVCGPGIPAWWIAAPALSNGVGILWYEDAVQDVAIYAAEHSAATILARYQAATEPWDGDTLTARITRLLDLAGLPAGLRDLDTGCSTLGPANLDGRNILDLLWEAVDFESGELFMARDGDLTFAQRTARYTDTTSTIAQATYSYTGANSTSGVSLDYSDELIRNHAVITAKNGGTFEAEDATSIGRYLRRTHKATIPQASLNDATALAQWIIQTSKDPQRRITALQVPTVRSTTTFDATVGLELGYRVTVTLDPPGAGTISEQVMVEGIDHDVTPQSWTTSLWCSPAPVPIVIVGVSLVGGSEVVGY